ncbi:MAG: tetratricopeptide repeat protein [Bacteroidales bacterium]|nr:tetratricopeptide repeat protein [Bacteroidales bacterium]
MIKRNSQFPITILAIVTFVTVAFVGCKSRSPQAGLAAYSIGEYDRAEKILYKHAKSADNKYDRAQYNFYLGDCYRLKGLYNKAVGAYKQAVKFGYKDAIVQLYLGDCYRQTGRFDEAAESYELYLRQRKTDNRAQYGLQSCALAKENSSKLMPDNKSGAAVDTGYQLVLMKPFNSKFSDFSPAYVGDDYEVVYFTSMRTAKRRRKVNRITGQGNSTIYVSKYDGGDEWTVPEALPEPWGSKIDDGTPNFSSDGKTMYFTRCPYNKANFANDPKESNKVENVAEAYEVTRSGGRWGEPVRIIPGGDSTMMVAHPAISPDGSTLYFVSDAPGGIGGKDIWLTRKTKEGWSKAENAGAMVNTKGDEMFPYVRDNGDLYFSSNGHIGYGGLDIFVAKPTATGRLDVKNLGLPFNSMGDDFGIVFQGNKEKGLLSSNRGNSKGIDHIYAFELPDVLLTMSGQLTDEKGNLVNKAFVRIVGSDGTNVKLHPNDDGKYGLTLERETDYIILCGAPGYENQKVELTTRGKNRTEKLLLSVKLKQCIP